MSDELKKLVIIVSNNLERTSDATLYICHNFVHRTKSALKLG
jgi:hypothetical protein